MSGTHLLEMRPFDRDSYFLVGKLPAAAEAEVVPAGTKPSEVVDFLTERFSIEAKIEVVPAGMKPSEVLRSTTALCYTFCPKEAQGLLNLVKGSNEQEDTV